MYVCMYESDASPQNKEAHFTAIVDAECLAAADAAVAATVVCSLTLSSLSVLLCSDVVCTQSDAMPRSSQCARTTVYRFVFSRLETWSGNFISRILLLFLFSVVCHLQVHHCQSCLFMCNIFMSCIFTPGKSVHYFCVLQFHINYLDEHRLSFTVIALMFSRSHSHVSHISPKHGFITCTCVL